LQFFSFKRFVVVMQRSAHSVDGKMSSLQEQLLGILKERSVCRGTFTLASGAQSDLYIDARQTTHDPAGAILVGRVGWELVKRVARDLRVQVDSIGGLTMGADPIAVSIGIFAHLENPSSELQTFVVRKEAKAHGRLKLIEGNFARGHSVVIVDDVITTGGSTLQAVDAIEAAGGKIAFVIVLVDREEGGRENIEKRGHKVVPIFTCADLIGTDAGRRPHIALA
jgi:orotate phosphoribosyltransferase